MNSDERAINTRDNYGIFEDNFRNNWNKNPPKCLSCLKPHYSYHYDYCKSCFSTWAKLGGGRTRYIKTEEEEKGKCLISDSDEEE